MVDSFPGVSASNKTAGVRFDVSTTGYKDLSVSWWMSSGSQASKYARLQYTTNGSAFIDFPTSVTTLGIQSNNLAGIVAVDGQTNFGIRIVTEFESTATGSGQNKYVTRSGGSYVPGTPIDFDMATVYGQKTGGAATLFPLAFVPDSHFQLGVTGSFGSTYIVQMSTNLAVPNWLPVQTNTSPFIFTESNTVAPQRFYRASFLP
jgi:hypothetical protein